MQLDSPLPEVTEALIRNVIGAAIEVHRHLGPGFVESIYEQALAFELAERGVSFERQKEILVPYKGQFLPGQRLDFLVGQQIIFELKAVAQLLPIHQAQLLSYLKSTALRAGLLINFNVHQLKLGIKRVIR